MMKLTEVDVMAHVLHSEIVMSVSYVICIEDGPNVFRVRVYCKNLSTDLDTLKHLAQVAEDVPQLLDKLLTQESTPKDIMAKARAGLVVSKWRL